MFESIQVAAALAAAPPTVLVGTVSDGAALRGVSLELYDGEGRELLAPIVSLVPGASWLNDLTTTGRFHIPHLAPGAYRLVLQAGDRLIERAVAVQEGVESRVEIWLE